MMAFLVPAEVTSLVDAGVETASEAAAASSHAARLGQLYAFVLIALGVSMLLALARLLRGPSLIDRVVALDLLAIFAAGVIALAAVATDRSELLIVAVLVALLAFMGTAAFAMFLERTGRRDAE